LTNFFSIWQLTGTERITFLGLCWLLVPQFLYFLTASAVLPDEIPAEGLDLMDFYAAERRYLYTLLLLAVVAEVIDDTVGLGSWEQTPVSYFTRYLPLNLAIVLSLLAMIWRQEKWVHWTAFGVLLVVSYFGILNWRIEGMAAVLPR
jgi:hypothetical protein